MDRLIRERKSLEPRLKRISDTVEKIRPEAAEEVDVQIELDALSEVWAAFCAVHKKILDVVKDRDSAASQQVPQSDVIRQLADQQAEFLRIMSSNMAAGSSSSAVVHSNVAASPLSDLKLPRMNMPVFSGNYMEWQSFYYLFDSLVHQNPTLKDSQKLYFLKTNLAGEAASLISHLKIEDANYQPALTKLKSRYDKPREIANQHIKRFLAQPTLTSPSSHGLRSLHDVSDEVIRALHAMNTWKTFVANRVAEISTHLPSINWSHVGTLHNPADMISRGAFPDQLHQNTLWWHGPTWDPSETDNESAPNGNLDDIEQRQLDREQRTAAVVCFTVYENRFLDDMMAWYYPNLQLLLRITARILRFGRPEFRCSPRLSPAEINFALGKYLQHTQQHFPSELSRLQRGLTVERSSPLHQLNPFLDENGVVRVGGRLQQSDLSYDNKHPILLPPRSILTSLILLHDHQEHLHCGPQSLLAATRTRSAARKVCRDCVKCNRAKAPRITQQMGQLPADRLKPLPPFTITGVDYAGPVSIVGRRTRGAVPSKGYVALFVCFATRAVHLEAVSDVSASAFLAAFTRFTSRYGVPSKMYSDNATNLRSASRTLRELYQQIDTTEHSDEVNDFLTDRRVEWLFIPARSHHGGLWEAGIKVAKGFLSKIGGNYNYTFEELSTLLAQVAACMNSRPISAISDDPADLQPLTPAHFLIGRPLDALPEVNHLEQQISSLSRWNYVQRVAQDFRARWQSEYVLALQRLVK
nr:uncharacterized protein LOC115259283 [Aedes albopictus]